MFIALMNTYPSPGKLFTSKPSSKLSNFFLNFMIATAKELSPTTLPGQPFSINACLSITSPCDSQKANSKLYSLRFSSKGWFSCPESLSIKVMVLLTVSIESLLNILFPVLLPPTKSSLKKHKTRFISQLTVINLKN
ncbi:hypothetical protein VCRA2117O380_140019 [Vibrio crassostreae]|nr:hypothetical protein VCRA2117O379_140019 [Vibrio crassostreae]CAK1770971.1 hypothetical protein VCRA2117O380_140019 [Vibrio crassostreae]CAK2420912.1 hypothetical protein VCRA2113O350_150018 [Vibrio crassostreae]CAK2579732.1 hypothetical protein VCRA2119O385_140114 [Vibrio crassostreae]CAK2630082.1 hypothetical protein VCRA2119O383_130114 [Vibrio crassostreae]